MSRAVWIGGGAGLALAALAWSGAGDALARLDAARAIAADARAEAAPIDRLADAPWRLQAPSARAAAAAVAARIRDGAKRNGVLVERAGAGAPVGPGLARLDLSLSGPEKAVLAVADAIERESRGARWERWRLEATAGGVRLSGSVAVAWR
ncbi:hypothetical protein COC42_04960 [Sphingomonas spermidinifaciens]|uniref:Uncharacterized protein n=1 Tax=Sphingomonas spermidinifaciens TaxID=1141889 RepID=A0A2A4B703_9SPHN|nr:hypothetical protein [Sphingomonas spermidinifaciens]PCD03705.1 hypothetical protein COC42_04960 [Sphingomonas spermidinifaciens]